MKKPAEIALSGFGYLFAHAAAFIGAACCCPGNTPGLLRGAILYQLSSAVCNFFCQRYPRPAPLHRLTRPCLGDAGSFDGFLLGLSLYKHQAGSLDRGCACHAQELDEGSKGFGRHARPGWWL